MAYNQLGVYKFRIKKTIEIELNLEYISIHFGVNKSVNMFNLYGDCN